MIIVFYVLIPPPPHWFQRIYCRVQTERRIVVPRYLHPQDGCKSRDRVGSSGGLERPNVERETTTLYLDYPVRQPEHYFYILMRALCFYHFC